MFQENKFRFQRYKTYQYCSCNFLFMLAQIGDTYFLTNNVVIKSLCKPNLKSKREIMDNYIPIESEFGSLEHSL